jgi:hypothetical protein
MIFDSDLIVCKAARAYFFLSAFRKPKGSERLMARGSPRWSGVYPLALPFARDFPPTGGLIAASIRDAQPAIDPHSCRRSDRDDDERDRLCPIRYHRQRYPGTAWNCGRRHPNSLARHGNSGEGCRPLLRYIRHGRCRPYDQRATNRPLRRHSRRSPSFRSPKSACPDLRRPQ